MRKPLRIWSTLRTSTHGLPRAGRMLLTALLIVAGASRLPGADALTVDADGDVSANNDLAVTGNLSVDGDTGLGTTSPAGTLHVAQDDSIAYPAPSATANDLVIENSTSNGITLLSPSDKSGWIFFGDQDASAEGEIEYDHASKFMMFKVEGSAKLRLAETGQWTQTWGPWNFNNAMEVWESFGHGRNGPFGPPPVQIRTCRFPASGSYLGCVTAKRALGQGCRILGLGSQRSMMARMRGHQSVSRAR